jgi:hypothetical protein
MVFTQRLAETSTRKRKKNIFLEIRPRPVSVADKLTAMFEPIVYTMLDPQHLTTL